MNVANNKVPGVNLSINLSNSLDPKVNQTTTYSTLHKSTYLIQTLLKAREFSSTGADQKSARTAVVCIIPTQLATRLLLIVLWFARFSYTFYAPSCGLCFAKPFILHFLCTKLWSVFCNTLHFTFSMHQSVV